MKTFTAEEQRSNLARLAKALLTQTFPVEFNMESYTSIEEEGDPDDDYCGDSITPDALKHTEHLCGTSCCAAGHLPFVINDTGVGEGWTEYLTRTLGINAKSNDAWGFLFSADWPSKREQFAARAYRYLTEGVDPDFNTENSLYDEVEPSAFDPFILPA